VGRLSPRGTSTDRASPGRSGLLPLDLRGARSGRPGAGRRIGRSRVAAQVLAHRRSGVARRADGGTQPGFADVESLRPVPDLLRLLQVDAALVARGVDERNVGHGGSPMVRCARPNLEKPHVPGSQSWPMGRAGPVLQWCDVFQTCLEEVRPDQLRCQAFNHPDRFDLELSDESKWAI